MHRRIALVGADKEFFTIVKEYLPRFYPKIHWLEFDNGFEIVNYCLNSKELPEIIILEVFLLKIDGIIVTDYLSTYLPDIGVLCVVEEIDNNLISNIADVGALGLINKSEPSIIMKIAYSNDDLYRVIKTTFIDFMSINKPVRKGISHHRNTIFKNYRITKRESLFILLNATALEYEEIATLMFISRKTVDNLFNSVAKKFAVQNRHNLTLFCIKMRLTNFSTVKKVTLRNIVYQ